MVLSEYRRDFARSEEESPDGMIPSDVIAMSTNSADSATRKVDRAKLPVDAAGLRVSSLSSNADEEASPRLGGTAETSNAVRLDDDFSTGWNSLLVGRSTTAHRAEFGQQIPHRRTFPKSTVADNPNHSNREQGKAVLLREFLLCSRRSRAIVFLLDSVPA